MLLCRVSLIFVLLCFIYILSLSLQDFRKILDDDSGILVRLRELFVDLVQEGFQDFFRQLEDQFLLFSGRNNSQVHGLAEGAIVEKAFPGLVLVLAQLSAFIEQTVIPKITEARIHFVDLDLITEIRSICVVIFPSISSRVFLIIFLVSSGNSCFLFWW